MTETIENSSIELPLGFESFNYYPNLVREETPSPPPSLAPPAPHPMHGFSPWPGHMMEMPMRPPLPPYHQPFPPGQPYEHWAAPPMGPPPMGPPPNLPMPVAPDGHFSDWNSGGGFHNMPPNPHGHSIHPQPPMYPMPPPPPPMFSPGMAPDPRFPPPGMMPGHGYPPPGMAPDPSFPPPGMMPGHGFPPPGMAPDPRFPPPGMMPGQGYPPPGMAPDPSFPPPGMMPDHGFPPPGMMSDPRYPPPWMYPVSHFSHAPPMQQFPPPLSKEPSQSHSELDEGPEILVDESMFESRPYSPESPTLGYFPQEYPRYPEDHGYSHFQDPGQDSRQDEDLRHQQEYSESYPIVDRWEQLEQQESMIEKEAEQESPEQAPVQKDPSLPIRLVPNSAFARYTQQSRSVILFKSPQSTSEEKLELASTAIPSKTRVDVYEKVMSFLNILSVSNETTQKETDAKSLELKSSDDIKSTPDVSENVLIRGDLSLAPLCTLMKDPRYAPTAGHFRERDITMRYRTDYVSSPVETVIKIESSGISNIFINGSISLEKLSREYVPKPPPRPLFKPLNNQVAPILQDNVSKLRFLLQRLNFPLEMGSPNDPVRYKAFCLLLSIYLASCVYSKQSTRGRAEKMLESLDIRSVQQLALNDSFKLKSSKKVNDLEFRFQHIVPKDEVLLRVIMSNMTSLLIVLNKEDFELVKKEPEISNESGSPTVNSTSVKDIMDLNLHCFHAFVDDFDALNKVRVHLSEDLGGTRRVESDQRRPAKKKGGRTKTEGSGIQKLINASAELVYINVQRGLSMTATE